MLTTILFVLSMFIAIWMTIITIGRLVYKQNLCIQMLLAAIGWTAVITHLIDIW